MFQIIDGAISPWENVLKLPPGVTSRQWLPEAVAYILEVPEDLMFDTFGAKVAKAVVGVILSIAPQWLLPMIVPNWSARDTEDMQGIAKHLVAEGLDPTPAELVKIAESLTKLRQGLSFGSWDLVAQAFGVKSLDTITAEFNQVGNAFRGVFGLPSMPSPPPQQPSQPTPPPIYQYPPIKIETPGFG